MKLFQCMTFTAIAATLLSTQTAARMGRPKADKVSTKDQYYETVLVQAKADKASYEKVIRSPTYAATPYPDDEDLFIDLDSPGKEGDSCRFPFPNCGSGLTCRDLFNGRPICHRNDTCRPRFMACLRDSDCCGNLRCPLLGVGIVFHHCE